MPTASKQTAVPYSYYPPTSTDPLGEFEQNHRSYISFREKGMDKIVQEIGQEGKELSPIDTILNGANGVGLFRLQRQFLNNVDMSKGPIQRKVVRLERRKDLDGEHLVVHVHWIAKDFLGNELEQDDIKEGMYNEPITRTTLEKGKTIRKYVNWQAKYDIPFTAKAVDDALENQINDEQLINYLVRVSRTTRDNSFSLEQFRDSTFEECVEISRQGKGLNR